MKKKILKHSAKAIPTETMTAFTEDEQEINSYLERGHELLKEKSSRFAIFSESRYLQ